MGVIQPRGFLKTVRWISFYSCALPLVVGAVLIANSAMLRMHGERVSGVVTGLKQERGADGDRVYRPEFSFSVDGQKISGVADISSNPPSYKPGDAIRLIYAKGHPEKARVDSFWSLWLFGIVFLITGVVGEVIVYFVFRAKLRALPMADSQTFGNAEF